jgi:hypothetical protein
MDRSSSHPPSLWRTIPRRKVSPLKKSVKALTLEDALLCVGQAHARSGAPDPRKDNFGGIDFRIQRQIKSYHKVGDPPRRVKPIPITIILYILAHAFGVARNEEDIAISDMIAIAFFFLLGPGEYTGTTADDTPFRLEDVALYICDRQLDVMTASTAELDAAISVSYKLTTQKNGTRDEKIVQGVGSRTRERAKAEPGLVKKIADLPIFNQSKEKSGSYAHAARGGMQNNSKSKSLLHLTSLK